MATDDQHGPDYPRELGPEVHAHRRKARGGLSRLPREQRGAYGDAVERAILRKQRAEFIRASCEPGRKANCASGTWHTTGDDIDAAIKKQQRAALAAAPSQERRARKPEVWQAMYDAAMVEKRARQEKGEGRGPAEEGPTYNVFAPGGAPFSRTSPRRATVTAKFEKTKS